MSRRSTQSAVTAREREVLSLIEAHLTNGQIADELRLSVRTVESHVSSLMRKLQVTDRRSLARRAERVGLGRPADHGRWPAEVSSFIGRESERDDLLAAVAEHRMVTVTGPGGVGKTRLAGWSPGSWPPPAPTEGGSSTWSGSPTRTWWTRPSLRRSAWWSRRAGR